MTKKNKNMRTFSDARWEVMHYLEKNFNESYMSKFVPINKYEQNSIHVKGVVDYCMDGEELCFTMAISCCNPNTRNTFCNEVHYTIHHEDVEFFLRKTQEFNALIAKLQTAVEKYMESDEEFTV